MRFFLLKVDYKRKLELLSLKFSVSGLGALFKWQSTCVANQSPNSNPNTTKIQNKTKNPPSF
jgi:hypothetical protein